MRLIRNLSLTITTTLLLVGCGGKNITLQDYADKWFNDVPSENNASTTEKIKRETPKHNPAADIAWSSMSKRDVRNKGEGSMQKSLDEWTEEEWDPTFEGDKEQVAKDKNASDHFTLQHYMDKRQKYLKAEEEKWEKSGKKKPDAHYEKMNRLPVIGK